MNPADFSKLIGKTKPKTEPMKAGKGLTARDFSLVKGIRRLRENRLPR